MPVKLRFGDIVDMRITTVDEIKKFKIAVCVEPDEWWFFYINTKHYSFAADSTMEISPSYLDRLTHTSYLNLHNLEFAGKEEIDSIDSRHIYRFNDPSLYKTMMYIIENSRIISKEQKEKIKHSFLATEL